MLVRLTANEWFKARNLAESCWLYVVWDPLSTDFETILLDRIDSYGAEILRTEALISELSLKFGASVSRVFVSERDWATLDSPFLDNVRRRRSRHEAPPRLAAGKYAR